MYNIIGIVKSLTNVRSEPLCLRLDTRVVAGCVNLCVGGAHPGVDEQMGEGGMNLLVTFFNWG